MLSIFNVLNGFVEALLMLLRAGAVALAIIIGALVGSAAVGGTLFGVYEGWEHQLKKLKRR